MSALTKQVGCFFAGRGDVIAAYVFGSQASGRATSTSDIDVAVVYRGSPPASLDSVVFSDQFALELALGTPVDLVDLRACSVDLAHRSIATGVVVADNDRAQRLRFEVGARNRFFDLAPVLDVYRRAPRPNAELTLQKLAFIETCLAQLRKLARPEVLFEDLVQQRFVEHTLQLAIQAALDVASHIAADERLGEPRTNSELFKLLLDDHWLESALAESLRKMAGFRNVLVHGYDDVDLSIVADALANRLVDLDAFVAAIRARMPSA